MDAVSISYGSHAFDIRVEYRDRRTMAISVLPDRSIVAVAPHGTALADIQQRLRRRARWIKKQVDYFTQFTPLTPPRRFVAGETHLYAGRQYRLKLTAGTANQVKLKGRFFHVSMTQPSAEAAEKLMKAWYRDKAHTLFQRRLRECMHRFPEFSAPHLQLRAFRARWGGMSPDGRLTLNPDLVRAPVECIDYVIIHELCHIEHPHHGPTFWRLLERKLPGWQQTKHRLEMSLK